MLRRSAWMRRGRPLAQARTRMRRVALRKGGMDKETREALREAHRTVVMLRGNAALFMEGKRNSWRGACDSCGKTAWLQCAHLLSVGAHPRLRYDPDNARPLCWLCHLGPGGWHKDPTFAKAYIERRIGWRHMEMLQHREQAAKDSPLDVSLTLVALTLEIARRTKVRA